MAPGAWPIARPLLHPIWAWLQAVQKTGGRQNAGDIPEEHCQHSAYATSGSLFSSPLDWADTSAEDTRAFTGGWIAGKPNSRKEETELFTLELYEPDSKFALADPSQCVASLELLGTLVRFDELVKAQHTGTCAWPHPWGHRTEEMQPLS